MQANCRAKVSNRAGASFFTSRIGLFQPLIYIEKTSDLYINGKRFIYKSKTIYI